jgi:pyrroline-5-carboxylate reductase
MMNENIGFIGFGKMAKAMIGGIIASKLVAEKNIWVSSRSADKVEQARAAFNINSTEDNKAVASEADFLFIAVPPNEYMTVIDEIKSEVKENAVIITVAAGITINQVEARFEKPTKVVRTMPNTPSFVGEGMTAICSNTLVNYEDLNSVRTLLSCFGEVEEIVEEKMDAIPAISGSSPAYVFMMIEAMADGGVKQGLSREQSYRLAAQAVLGAAKMVLETGSHPAELKDQVCSPGGATIEAVATLEEKQFRGAILAAMNSCTEKVKQLSKV